MQKHQRISLLKRLVIAAIASAGVAAMAYSDFGWRLDARIYDLMLPSIAGDADDRIVVVTIDDKSLAELGQWPWPRSVHARFLERFEKANIRAIGFDLVLAEPSRQEPDGDRILAAAIRDNGRVVLPVLAEPGEPYGAPIEILPLPELTKAAAGLGHAEVGSDDDGVARHAHLHAGVSTPHWPAFALALYQAGLGNEIPSRLDTLRNAAPIESESTQLWVRDHRILIPYASPGGLRQVSYVDVLNGKIPVAEFSNSWIIVGVTASGLSQNIMIPNTGMQPLSSGVHYHANVLNALILEKSITPLPLAASIALAMLLVLLPVVLYRSGELPMRSVTIFTAVQALNIAACYLLLRFESIWFPPSSVLVVLGFGYILWLLLSLGRSQKLAHSDGLTQLANRHMFDLMLDREQRSAKRTKQPLSLVLIDIDHFKGYNDLYGHRAGDTLLRKISLTIMTWTRRPRDLSARYGGDEIAIVLPETSRVGAMTVADGILNDIRKLAIPHSASLVDSIVTLSIGVATYEPTKESKLPELLERADAALYQAKNEGRNRLYTEKEAMHSDAGSPRP